jgi:hypothetical protein
MSAPNPKAFPLANAQLTNQVCRSLEKSMWTMTDGADPRFGSAGFSLQAIEEGVSRLSSFQAGSVVV